MLNVPWIINNMISEPNKTIKLRRPSEIEMKVKKSLQQLTVPDWYTNKSRPSPKIITDRRPIESRPAPWKDNERNRLPLLANNPRKNPMPNTAVVRPVGEDDNYKTSESQMEWDKLNELKKTFGMKADRCSQIISETFPKISPSRKIQNINIVFPTTSSAIAAASSDTPKREIRRSEIIEPFKKLNFTNGSDDRREMSVDSLDEESTSTRKNSIFNNDSRSIYNGLEYEYPLKNSTARTLNFKDSPRGSEKKISRIGGHFTADNNPQMITSRTNGGEDKNCLINDARKNKIELLTPSKYYKIAKTTMIDESSNYSVEEFQSMEENNKINREIIISPKIIERSLNGSRNSSYENNNNKNKNKEDELLNENLFSSPRKSTEMENMIKKENNQPRRSTGGKKSLVEEIIEELNAKCNITTSPKVKSNYVSPGSKKNFVKKLVRALEMGFPIDDDDEKNNEEINFETSYFDSKSNSSECYSSSASTASSVKDSDSGSDECDSKTSSRSSNCSSPFRSFSRALEDRDTIKSRGSVTPYVDDEDESVFWIPLPTSCKLPRTSSLKNMMSRISSSPAKNNLSSQIISTISTTNNSSTTTTNNSRNIEPNSGWGKTFDKGHHHHHNHQSNQSRQLFRIDETTVIDSGYSDRSVTNSSRSSSVLDEYYHDDSLESTKTAIEQINAESYAASGYSNNSLQQTFELRMLRSRQRTSVV